MRLPRSWATISPLPSLMYFIFAISHTPIYQNFIISQASLGFILGAVQLLKDESSHFGHAIDFISTTTKIGIDQSHLLQFIQSVTIFAGSGVVVCLVSNLLKTSCLSFG